MHMTKQRPSLQRPKPRTASAKLVTDQEIANYEELLIYLKYENIPFQSWMKRRMAMALTAFRIKYPGHRRQQRQRAQEDAG